LCNFTLAASSLDVMYWIHARLRFNVLKNLDSVSPHYKIKERQAGCCLHLGYFTAFRAWLWDDL